MHPTQTVQSGSGKRLGLFLLLPFILGIICFSVILYVDSSRNWLWMNARPLAETLKVWAEVIKTLAEIFAYVSAGVFFFWKFTAGYFVTDASVTLTCKREHSDTAGIDHISVIATIKKGEKSGVQLHDARARFTTFPSGRLISIKKMEGFERFSSKVDSGTDRMSILFEPSRKRPCLNLPPGDQVQFSSVCECPSNESVVVDVTVLGRSLVIYSVRRWLPSSITGPTYRVQWRSSDVSLVLPQSVGAVLPGVPKESANA